MNLRKAYRLVMEIKEYITEWWVGQRRNQERNEAILVIKKKTQQNVGYIKSSPEREIYKSPILKKKKKSTNKWFNDATQEFRKSRTNQIQM